MARERTLAEFRATDGGSFYGLTCEGHVETPDEDYARLRERYGTDTVGFVAELAKKNSERKLMHQMLTTYGIPSETPEGRALCLLARLGIMGERLRSVGL
jgi:hypothetical protein